MERQQFIKSISSIAAMSTLSNFKNYTDTLLYQGKTMPVLFTSHGNPMDIPLQRNERPFWETLYQLGNTLRSQYDMKAVLVVSAHWCSRGTFVNIAEQQQQIYDFSGFPKECYEVKYHAKGSPAIAHEVTKLVPTIAETTEWGLDHGAWPMLQHLLPNADVPVFQLSISYYEKPEYHYQLAQQLKSLRQKGVLMIGSGSLIHNLPLVMQKMRMGDLSPFSWEAEYDSWLKTQLDSRNIANLIHYETSHKLGKLAAPTPDHFVPVLYSLGLMDSCDKLEYFYEGTANIPAFSERSFMLSTQ
jgi:4,5-DOPA dioxygenase extradiol